jgi:hypothetical protein
VPYPELDPSSLTLERLRLAAVQSVMNRQFLAGRVGERPARPRSAKHNRVSPYLQYTFCGTDETGSRPLVKSIV